MNVYVKIAVHHEAVATVTMINKYSFLSYIHELVPALSSDILVISSSLYDFTARFIKCSINTFKLTSSVKMTSP